MVDDGFGGKTKKQRGSNMEQRGQTYQKTLILWSSFLFSIIIYGIMVGFLVGPYPLDLQIYKQLFTDFNNFTPGIVKIFLLVGIIEFFFFFTIQKGILPFLKSKNPFGKYVILWGFAEVPALLGFVASFVSREAVFFVPMFVLSLIAIILSFPKKGDFEEKKDLPYSFE